MICIPKTSAAPLCRARARLQSSRLSAVLMVGFTLLNGCGGGSTPPELASYPGRGSLTVKSTPVRGIEDIGLVQDIRTIGTTLMVASNSHICKIDTDGQARCHRLSGAERSPTRVRLMELHSSSRVESAAPGVAVLKASGSRYGTMSAITSDQKTLWSAALSTPYSYGILKRGDKDSAVVMLRDTSILKVGTSNGKVVDSLAINADVVECADLEGKGDSQIAYLSGGKLGLISSDNNSNAFISADEFVVATGSQSADRLIVRSADDIVAIGPELRAPIRLHVPDRPWRSLWPVLHFVDAAVLQLQDQSNLYLILLAGRGGWHRSVFLIFDEAGRTVYDEVLDRSVGAIYPLGDGESFLLGTFDQVIRYQVSGKS